MTTEPTGRQMPLLLPFYHTTTRVCGSIMGISLVAERIGANHKTVKAWRDSGRLRAYNAGQIDLCEAWDIQRTRRIGNRAWCRSWSGNDPRPGVIYGIFDPRRPKDIRYVGKAGSMRDRWQGHCKDAKSRRNRLYNWWRKRESEGGKPCYRILQECLPGMMDACEREWIAKLNANGRLLNVTDGGDGGIPDENAKKKLAEISRSKWQTDGYRKRWVEAMSKRWGKAPELLTQQQKQERKRQKRKQYEALLLRQAEERKKKKAEKNPPLYPISGRGGVYVPLTQGKWAVVDPEDWERVAKYNWYAARKGRLWRAVSHGPSDGKTALLGRYVMEADAQSAVVSKDGNPLNCRRENLRVCPMGKHQRTRRGEAKICIGSYM